MTKREIPIWEADALGIDTPIPIGGQIVQGHVAYRLLLWRHFVANPRRLVCFIGLNPSTALKLDDPTTRRLNAFAYLWGYDGYTLVNLFPRTATDPADLWAWSVAERLGGVHAALAVQVRTQAIREAELVVPCWGDFSKARAAEKRWAKSQAEVMLATLRALRVVPRVFDLAHGGGASSLTASGQPGHPLYLAADTPAIVWPDWRPL